MRKSRSYRNRNLKRENYTITRLCRSQKSQNRG